VTASASPNSAIGIPVKFTSDGACSERSLHDYPRGHCAKQYAAEFAFSREWAESTGCN
jgi:hypothetical protein